MESALRAEIEGKLQQRGEFLSQALRVAPDYAPGRWHTGQVRFGEKWMGHAEVSQQVKDSPLLAEYLRAPDLTARRLYLETMAITLPRFRSKLIVATESGVDLTIVREEEE